MSHPRNAKREARRESRRHIRASSRVQRIVFPSLAASLALTIAVPAVSGATAGNPYEGIVERNVFSLKPPPAPGPPPAAPAPAVKLTLTGITTILGKKQALLSAAIPPMGSAQPAKQESYILAEGQRDGEVEVVSIDEGAGIVKVINRGSPETLDFVNNGAKIVSTGPGPGGAPGMTAPPMPGLPAPQPGGPPGGGMRQIPPRLPRTQTQSYNEAQPGGAPGAVAPSYAPSQQQANVQPNVDAETQVIMIEAQRMNYIQHGDPTHTILPPTELTQEVTGGDGTPPPAF